MHAPEKSGDHGRALHQFQRSAENHLGKLDRYIDDIKNMNE